MNDNLTEDEIKLAIKCLDDRFNVIVRYLGELKNGEGASGNVDRIASQFQNIVNFIDYLEAMIAS